MSTEVKINNIIETLKKEFKERGFSKAIIGLSGGVDSAVSLALTAKAIGEENIIAVRMPYKTSNPVHLKDATLVAESVGVKEVLTREITVMVDSFKEAAEIKEDERLRIGNIAARCRMITLFDLAKKEKALVVGTENRTENLFGYYTRFGDAASDIEPITSLYKTEVWEIAKLLGLPEEVLTKSPSADLWSGQTDEGELGVTYKEADAILSLLIDKKLEEKEIEKLGFSEETIEKVELAIAKNSFKKDLPVLIEA